MFPKMLSSALRPRNPPKSRCLALPPRRHAAEGATAVEQHHPGPKRLIQLGFYVTSSIGLSSVVIV